MSYMYNQLRNLTAQHHTKSRHVLENFNKVYGIDGSYTYRFNNDLKTELNHFTSNFYQIGVRDVRTYLTTSLLELVWGKTFYHELRTVKQYGYIVNGGKRVYDNIMVKYIG